MIRSRKILDSAKGQDCTMKILGVCNGDPETTVAAHLPDHYKGTGLKTHDIFIVYACSSCHDVMDGRVKSQEFKNHASYYYIEALKSTLLKLVKNGIMKV